MCGGVTGKSVFRKLAVPDVLGAAVFVSRVQSVICSFDENFAPLDQCCGQESEEGADDHFLHEGGVHLALFGAREVPPRKWPFPRKLQGPTSNYQQGRLLLRSAQPFRSNRRRQSCSQPVDEILYLRRDQPRRLCWLAFG